MNLQEFIKETLLQVINGVIEAQNTLGQTNGAINPFTRGQPIKPTYKGLEVGYIDFDVAVTVTEGSGVAGGLSVMGIGAKGDLSSSTSSVSRIKFTVPVALPPGTS